MQEGVEAIVGVKHQPFKHPKNHPVLNVDATWTLPFSRHWLSHRAGLDTGTCCYVLYNGCTHHHPQTQDTEFPPYPPSQC